MSVDVRKMPRAVHEALEWTATEAVEHIRSGSITAERYASQLLDQYRATTQLCAITWIDENRVLESARAVDTARSQGQRLGPVAGLPLAIKDNLNTVGFPTTGGTDALRNFYPQQTARVVESLFQAGAILLGKANMDELGRNFTNSNAVYGFAKNPYDVTRVPGGGAGGTAIAVSARITPAGLASDTAGSARVPASFCGIAGLRPSTSGRIHGWTFGSWTASTLDDGLFPIAWAVSTPAPMGRSAADVALLDAVVAGRTPSPPISVRGVRLGVPRGFYWEDLDPEVARVSEAALLKLRQAGAVLVEVNLREWGQTALPTFLTLATMRGMRDVVDFLEHYRTNVTLGQVVASIRSRDIRAFTDRIIANPVPPDVAENAVKTRLKLAAEYEKLFRERNLAALVYPTVPVQPVPIRPEGDQPGDTIDLNGKQVNQFQTLLRNTHVSGVIGIPSVSLHAGMSSSGLPVGLTLSGLADDDRRLLGLAQGVEAVFGRAPAPTVRETPEGRLNVVGAARPAPPPSSPPRARPGAPPAVPQATSGAMDSLDRILTLLKQSAYLNLVGIFDVPDPERSGAFTARAPLNRYAIDFRIDGCGTGMGSVNLNGDVCGHACLNWTFPQAGAAQAGGNGRRFTVDDVFVLDDDSRSQFRGAGSGRVARSRFGDGGLGVEANGNIVEGTGVFAGVQGSYVLTGHIAGSRLHIHFTVRLMDPTGVYQTTSELLPRDGTQPADRLLTKLAVLGEADPDHPVQLTPTGATVHELLRAVHTEFDYKGDKLEATIGVGPIVARWRTDVLFNPADPNAPGTPDRPLAVKLENIRIDFLDQSMGSLEASMPHGLGFAMQFPGVSGPLFRMTGFGPIGPGTGLFRSARGALSMLGAIDLAPAAFSNYYLLHIVDPDGQFRC
ncbi:MAG: hypothetical protein HYU37_09700 [Acidobacteria bacterium]|nr:hypothetical protein [Acidobacteriota bacterium]